MEALGDEQGDNGRETSAIRTGACARQNVSPERPLLAIPVKNTGQVSGDVNKAGRWSKEDETARSRNGGLS
jgi:hypothetical protein